MSLFKIKKEDKNDKLYGRRFEVYENGKKIDLEFVINQNDNESTYLITWYNEATILKTTTYPKEQAKKYIDAGVWRLL